MTILIEQQETDPNGTSFVAASCGNKSAWVSACNGGEWVTVCCKNAAHRVWRGSGKTFGSFADALEAYRSPEMRAIIEAAREIIAPSNIVQFQPTPP
jgi:hypothetical protein